MFFVFPFLLLNIYVSEINNFVLKEDSQDDGSNVKQDDRDLIFQDVHNVSSVFPTRKSVFHVIRNLNKTQRSNPKFNQINKKLSDEVPIKRHIQDNDEEYTSTMFKNTKSSIATPPLESKRKWPVVELLSESDDFKQNSHYFDEFDKKQFPFFHDIEKESKITDFPPKLINNFLDPQTNNSKVKPGLRSLPQLEFPGISCEDGDTCVCRLPNKGKTSPKCSFINKCTRTTIMYSLVNFYLPYEIVNIPKNIPTGTPKPTTKATPTRPNPKGIDMGIPIGIPMGVPMGVPMGMPAGYPMGFPQGYPGGYLAGYPAGYPAALPAGLVAWPEGPQSYYQPNTVKEVPKQKPCKTQSDDYLYYDDDDEPENIYVYNEDSFGKNRKHERKHKGGILIDVEYDIEESRDQKPNRNSKWRDNEETLAANILDDLKRSYSDTVIKNCYCCLASSYEIKAPIVFLWLILVMFC